MSREIKFRAWNKKRKRLYKVVSVHFNELDRAWATVEGFSITERKTIHINIQPKDCVLMQYTGLKDKNGKEIYEGDIVIYVDSGNVYVVDKKGEVVFHNCGFCIKCNTNIVGTQFYPIVSNEAAFFTSKKIKVIGNIYENPELLENPNPDNIPTSTSQSC